MKPSAVLTSSVDNNVLTIFAPGDNSFEILGASHGQSKRLIGKTLTNLSVSLEDLPPEGYLYAIQASNVISAGKNTTFQRRVFLIQINASGTNLNCEFRPSSERIGGVRYCGDDTIYMRNGHFEMYTSSQAGDYFTTDFGGTETHPDSYVVEASTICDYLIENITLHDLKVRAKYIEEQMDKCSELTAKLDKAEQRIEHLKNHVHHKTGEEAYQKYRADRLLEMFEKHNSIRFLVTMVFKLLRERIVRTPASKQFYVQKQHDLHEPAQAALEQAQNQLGY